MSNAGHTFFEEVAQLEAHAQNQLNGRVRNLRLVIQEKGLILLGQARTASPGSCPMVSTFYSRKRAQGAVSG